MIAHGVYGYSIPAGTSDAIQCKAVNHKTGEEFPFDENALKKLHHDISHLTADLLLTFSRLVKIEGPWLAFSDTHLLQASRESTRPQNPNPDKRPLPPESSQA
jgi:hypothetical protein